MKYTRFEDTPAWQSAADLFFAATHLAEDPAFNGRGDLRDQLQRAALSVSNNIAEGFERGTTNELVVFLYYSKGSAGEVRSMLTIAEHLPCFSHLKSEISNLKSLAESISRQLSGWTQSLQNSDIKGVKYLNDVTRDKADQSRRAQAFITRLNDMNEQARKAREAGQDRPPTDQPP